ncbi:energy coupling factor transporter S component ThiW [Macrococcus epidermidis]|uniref:Energy coupling factor transporter S component ThiW n=1 Tax=Macrococcus epidermidis TaxID=1902580 RepID=A0A327ZWG7_9STAP|nr:energy coupling factor transporter S component ThiW [Macrococcus epidermidis]MCG7419953.1 energy coupling factor transporter S component ThiW [Macrococcus epidermidis]RAK46579.1 energy coupling factor transporter S component ThiW [Macrococcus epidermidis]UTH17374.1 energy coupling factor transporter S component ThiW [Macrococcus epidermidis]
MRNDTKKLTLTSIFIAMNVVLSQMIYIPVGPIKAFPMQHFINVLCAVFVGPWYGLAQAFISSALRNFFGTGSLFAFPGSMIGVLLASLLYRKFKRIEVASIGEWIGTGLIGSVCTIPLMWMMQIDMKGFMPIFYAFLLSSLIGSIIAYILLVLLNKRNLLTKRNG